MPFLLPTHRSFSMASPSANALRPMPSHLLGPVAPWARCPLFSNPQASLSTSSFPSPLGALASLSWNKFLLTHHPTARLPSPSQANVLKVLSVLTVSASSPPIHSPHPDLLAPALSLPWKLRERPATTFSRNGHLGILTVTPRTTEQKA